MIASPPHLVGEGGRILAAHVRESNSVTTGRQKATKMEEEYGSDLAIIVAIKELVRSQDAGTLNPQVSSTASIFNGRIIIIYYLRQRHAEHNNAEVS